MVEAAGIEPASEKVRTKASTRLADSFFYLTTGPLNGKWIGGQPKIFARQLWASLPGLSRIIGASSDRLGKGYPGDVTA